MKRKETFTLTQKKKDSVQGREMDRKSERDIQQVHAILTLFI